MNQSNTKKIIVAVILTVVVLIGVLVFSNFLRDPTLYVIGNSEMEAILNEDSGVGTFVYIGRPTCPVCVKFQPTLERAISDLDQQLPYYETDLANLEDSKRRSEIFDRLDVSGVPIMVYIENGQVVDTLIGYQSQDAIHEFFEANGGFHK